MTWNKLKVAWKQYCLESTLQGISRNEILLAIEDRAEVAWYRQTTMLINTGVFFFLLLCCQGG